MNNLTDDELDVIASFMNEPVKEDVDKNELENTLDYINTQLTASKPQIKDLSTIEEVDEQEHTIDELTDIALKALNKIDNKTDEIYDLFYKPLLLGKDRSDASKQGLIESQRIKVEMVNALAGLANAKAKLEMARAKANSNSGVFINASSGSDVGISLHNLWEGTKD
jgi:hypothetical protein